MTKTDNLPPKNLIKIKKYANRRLYNTAISSYITLENISAMVRGGQNFAVFDAKSGHDITSSILMQIIVKEEAQSNGQNMLPLDFLRQIILLYGHALQGLVPNYLNDSIKTFMAHEAQAPDQVSSPNPKQK